MARNRRSMRPSLLVLLILLGLPTGRVCSQTPAADAGVAMAMQERGPRFLVASGARYLPVDVKRTPILHRRLSLRLSDVTVAEALAEISGQSGLAIAYSEDIVPVHGRVQLHASDIPVAAALTAVLLEANVDVVFTPDGRAALVQRLPLPAGQPALAVITGIVTDLDSGDPLSDATVVIVQTRASATTDANGRYRIANVAPGAYTVTVRRVGYAPVSRSVDVPDEPAVTLDFTMSHVVSVLDQIVVTASGEGRAKEEGNARTIVTSESFRDTPVADPQQVLTGQVPGLTVLSNSGQPGAGGTIVLRGINSISTDNSPIIYIDGVRMFNDLGLTSFTGRQGYLPMNDIAATDIDRIEVVKGAAATTLYGTQASGGVIQIFTRRGQPGRARWSFVGSTGFNRMGRIGPDDDNPTGLFMNRCRGADLVDVRGTPVVDPTCPASGSWFENGWLNRLDLSVGGGTDGGSTYYVSGSYGDENGVIQGAGHTQGGVRANFSFTPSRAWVVTVSSSYMRGFTRWVPDGDNSTGLFQNVALGPFGRFIGGASDECAGVSAPAVCVLNARALTVDSHTETDHFTTSLTAAWQQTAAIDHRFTAGYDYNLIQSADQTPFGFPTIPLGSLRDISRSRGRLSLEYAGTWRATVGSSVSSALSIGAQAFREDGGFRWLGADNFAGPVDPTLTSGGIFSVTRDSSESVVNGGFFIQDVLGFQDRLFLTAGLRVDGSTAFGDDYGLQPYPKIGLSYVVSSTAWWPRWWSTLRVRGAYGESGKAPRSFDKLATWSGVPADSGISGLIPGAVGDANLGPERTKELEAGFDAGWFGDRVMLEVTAFRARTSDALVPVSPIPSLGFISPQLRNVGSLQTTGAEFRVTAGVLQTRWLDWSVRGNLSIINTKARDVGGTRIFTFMSGVEAGLAVPTYFGSKVANPDAFADPVIETNQPLGRVYPNRLLGLGTTVRIGPRLSIDAQGDGQFGGHLMSTTAQLSALRGVWPACYPVQRKLIAFADGDASALDDVTALERARCTLSTGVANAAYWILPSDFFRLRTLSVTYQLPIGGTQAASVTLAARNLALWTEYGGLDPEVQDLADPWGSRGLGRREFFNLPPSRTFVATVRITY